MVTWGEKNGLKMNYLFGRLPNTPFQPAESLQYLDLFLRYNFVCYQVECEDRCLSFNLNLFIT